MFLHYKLSLLGFFLHIKHTCKHCIKQTSISDGKQLDKIVINSSGITFSHQSHNIERENKNNPVYLEPISNVFYEEIESNAETDNLSCM